MYMDIQSSNLNCEIFHYINRLVSYLIYSFQSKLNYDTVKFVVLNDNLLHYYIMYHIHFSFIYIPRCRMITPQK